MTITRFLMILLLLYLLFYQVYRAARLLLQMLGRRPAGPTPKFRLPDDVSHRNLSPPAELRPLIDEFERLGFSRVGEVQMKTRPTRQPITAWLFSDPGHELTAEVFLPLEPDIPPVAGLGTMFGKSGNAYVLTHFREPFPETLGTVTEADFRVTNVTASLADALATHRRHVDELRAEFGAPYPSRTVKDYLHKSRVYMRRFFLRRRAGSRYASGLRKANALLAAELTLTIALLVATLLVSAPLASWLLSSAFVAVFLGFELSLSRHWKRVLGTSIGSQPGPA